VPRHWPADYRHPRAKASTTPGACLLGCDLGFEGSAR
jgi:hypothetical protein